MLILLWDASALTKRYVPETGREVVSTLFALVPASQMITTFVSYAETHAVLIRKRNGGILNTRTYRVAASALQVEVIESDDFGVLEVETSAFLTGIELVKKHILNASDAAILATFILYEQLEAAMGDQCIFVASDERLLRAADAEGMKTLNPETIAVADIAAFLASL